MRKVEVESWEQLVADELSLTDATEPDEFVLDSEWHELSCERSDDPRWELDPASADDWIERHRGWTSGPAMKWRHFGH